MKIYIDEKKCTGCGKCKVACPKDPRVYSIEEKHGKRSAF
jgi:ferredoxin